MSLLYITLFAVCCIHLRAAAQPSDPVWPMQFYQEFNETSNYIAGAHHAKGKYYYDLTNLSSRIDRDNGRYDLYCGINGARGFKDTPCTQLVVDGMMWIYYPEKKDCCQ